jgi:hypothetical protein
MAKMKFYVRHPIAARKAVAFRVRRFIQPARFFLLRYWTLAKFSRISRLLRSDDHSVANRLLARLRQNSTGAISLLGLLEGEKLTLVPIRQNAHSNPNRYAPTAEEYSAWLAGPNIGLNLVKHHDAILARFGQQPISQKEWRAFSFLFHTEPDSLLAENPEVLLTRNSCPQSSTVASSFDPTAAPFDVRRRRAIIELSTKDPELAPYLHSIEADGKAALHMLPYDDGPPPKSHVSIKVPATPRKRSVLFVNPAYYNFYYLAKSLRQRGWDAVAMSTINPDSSYAQQFHGHDWTIYDSDQRVQIEKLSDAFKIVSSRFDMLHFHGVGVMSMFPYNYDTGIDHDRIPWDVLEMKRRGAKIAYSITGCHDLVTPSAFVAWSPTMCPKCAWRDRPEICSDGRMAAWGWKVQQLADLICVETDPPLDFRDTPATFREPLSYAVDPDFWRPDLARETSVPAEWKVAKSPGEIFVYHSVGNFEARTRDGVNVKGTGSVIRAIERLREEGHLVSLLFRKEVPSLHNRWILAQADIIVDQLNYGRYGATAREGLMLGRPVVGRVEKSEPYGLSPVRCIAECPIIDANEGTVYDVLKRLVENASEREAIGAASRAHALKWWARDVLAERYERVYDHLHIHGRPPTTLD